MADIKIAQLLKRDEGSPHFGLGWLTLPGTETPDLDYSAAPQLSPAA